MMKKSSLLALAIGAVLSVSCDKAPTEAERNAQIEREVQQRLAAERQADEQQRLAQGQSPADTADLTVAQQNALPEQTATSIRRPVAQPSATSRTTSTRAASNAPKSYDTFYRKLEPYGAWRETSDYGYVWQPQQAQRSRDWRPYTDGRWAYTDAGWTWVSEEPFGWATYHYGRWTRLRNVGWVWVPGEEWAPAWVSWRKSDEYVGWAPLPPEAHFDRRRGIQKWADSYYDIDADEYVFVPNESIGSQRLERDVVPVEQNVTIVNQTVNVTNITYNNTTVVNEGPNYEELRSRSRQPVERFRLERQFDADTDAPQSVVRGDVLSVTTPVFTARAVERPTVVGEPIRQVTVERSWAANANQVESQRAREKMKSEATPPPDAPPKRYDKPVEAQPTAAPIASASPSPSASATAASVATASPRLTASPSATATMIPRATATPSPTSAATATPIATATPTATARATATPSGTSTPAATATPTAAFSPRTRPSPTVAATASPIPTATAAAPTPVRSGPRSTPPLMSPIPSAPAAESDADAPAPNGMPRGQDPRRTGGANGSRDPRRQPAPPVTASPAAEGAEAADTNAMTARPRTTTPPIMTPPPGRARGAGPAPAAPTAPPAITPPPPRATPPVAPAMTPPPPPAATPIPAASTPPPPPSTPRPTATPSPALTAPAAAEREEAADPARPGRNGRGVDRRRPNPLPPGATPSPTAEGDATDKR